MNVYEFIITPIFLALYLYIIVQIRNKSLQNSPLKKYFLPGALIKFAGAITAGLIYEIYYGGGAWDTFNFHNIGAVLISAFTTSFSEGFALLNLDAGDYEPDLMIYIGQFYSWYFREDSAFFIGKLSGVIGLFCFNSYYTIACTFALFSFIGNWQLLRTFNKVFPQYTAKIIFPLLYLPSVIFWGSGLFKDSIAFGCIGILVYAFYQLVIERRNIIFNLIQLILFSYVGYIVKEYVFVAFYIAAGMFAFQSYRLNIKYRFVRALITLFIIGISGFYLSSLIQTQIVESTINTVKDMQDWHNQVSSQHSAYSLGNYNASIIGISSKLLPALNVAFFRPYVWEASGAVMMISALENLYFLFLFVSIFFYTSPIQVYKNVTKHPFLLFSVIFAITLGFMVGFTTYNFGALVRYKIPFLPFFVSALILLKIMSKELKAARKAAIAQ